MSKLAYLCIQTQKGAYVFPKKFETDLLKTSEIIEIGDSEEEWLARFDESECFVADRISFVMREILKQRSAIYITQNPLLIPFYSEDFTIEIFSNDDGGLICYFFYHQSLQEFLNKYDIFPHYNRYTTLLPLHIQELELQELFLINEGRISMWVSNDFECKSLFAYGEYYPKNSPQE